jgi:hypothetical protein
VSQKIKMTARMRGAMSGDWSREQPPIERRRSRIVRSERDI